MEPEIRLIHHLIHHRSLHINSMFVKIFWALGRQCDSSSGANGNGTSGEASNCGGLFHLTAAWRPHQRNHAVAQHWVAPLSCTTSRRPVFSTDRTIGATSHGCNTNGLITSMLYSELAAAASISSTIAPKATRPRRSLPCSGAASRWRQLAVKINVTAAAPVKELVFQHQAWIRVVKAGQQGLERFLRRGRIKHLQPRKSRPQARRDARLPAVGQAEHLRRL